MISTNLEKYEKEYSELISLFDDVKNIEISASFIYENNALFSAIKINETEFSYFEKANYLQKDKFIKRFSKIHLYMALSKFYNKSLPWGCLTGVTPTAISNELYKAFGSLNTVKAHLISLYGLQTDKAELLIEIIKTQKTLIRNDKLIDLYIHIPFCPSRCNYCSFYSNDIKKCNGTVQPYICALINEIASAEEIITKGAYIVNSIYVGGGTPTALSVEDLDAVLSAVNYKGMEFTVECGRADTITEEKLQILKKHGVTRISINPQTFNERVLKNIGREVSNSSVFQAYSLALKYGFEVNMDFIAGLPKESLTSFKKSMDTVIELSPHNITVHTLALKRGAILNKDDIDNSGTVKKMIDYSAEILRKNGYTPYYVYRQKNCADNLENVGYTLPGSLCKYNIDTIEETTNVLAVGSGAITKKVGYDGNIVRQSNSKDLFDYIYRVSEYIQKKTELFLK